MSYIADLPDFRARTKHSRKQVRSEPTIVSVIDQQPDDRPRIPSGMGLSVHNAGWVSVMDILVTQRTTDKPRGWASVVASFDAGTSKGQMVRSQSRKVRDERQSFTGKRQTRQVRVPAPIAAKLAEQD